MNIQTIGPDPEMLARFDRVLTLVERMVEFLAPQVYPDRWIVGEDGPPLVGSDDLPAA